MTRNTATAFAPASVGNVGIGFDILGFAVDALGDRVCAMRSETPGVRITGCSGVVADIPLEAEKNTAGRRSLPSQSLRTSIRYRTAYRKGDPARLGLGGSAASAVAAVVAANALLDQPFEKIDLLKFAMQGEAVASGSMHVDNIAPSLFGGLVLTVGIDNPV